MHPCRHSRGILRPRQSSLAHRTPLRSSTVVRSRRLRMCSHHPLAKSGAAPPPGPGGRALATATLLRELLGKVRIVDKHDLVAVRVRGGHDLGADAGYLKGVFGDSAPSGLDRVACLVHIIRPDRHLRHAVSHTAAPAYATHTQTGAVTASWRVGVRWHLHVRGGGGGGGGGRTSRVGGEDGVNVHDGRGSHVASRNVAGSSGAAACWQAMLIGGSADCGRRGAGTVALGVQAGTQESSWFAGWA